MKILTSITIVLTIPTILGEVLGYEFNFTNCIMDQNAFLGYHVFDPFY